LDEIISFAKKKHEGQIRKITKVSYINHPMNVAKILINLKENDDLIKAAYLHDTIEDTDTTFEELKIDFGKVVAKLVRELTSDDLKIKKLGKVTYLANKMNHMSSDAFTVKLADRLDNVTDLSTDSLSFSNHYAKQTQKILNMIDRELNDNQKYLTELIKEKIKSYIK